jgi:hypothetical protein
MQNRIWLGALAALIVLGASTADAAPIPDTPGWHVLANTRLRSVCAVDTGFPQVAGVNGCRAITYAWSGGAFDTRRNRLIVFGGGHNDYYGNEIYAVNVGSSTVERLTDPGLPIATSCVESIAGGTQPNSRHTYDGVEYLPTVDKLFIFGGALACAGGFHGGDTWMFDFATKRWQNMQPSGPQPQKEVGILTAYDPNTGLVLLHDRRFLFSYDPVANRYTQLTTQNAYFGYTMSATLDPVRKRFVLVRHYARRFVRDDACRNHRRRHFDRHGVSGSRFRYSNAENCCVERKASKHRLQSRSRHAPVDVGNVLWGPSARR